MADFDFENEIAAAEWLTQALANSGALTSGHVVSVKQMPSAIGGNSGGTFHQITPTYSEDAQGAKPASFLMKITKIDLSSIPQEAVGHILNLISAEFFQPQKEQSDLYRKEVVFFEATKARQISMPLTAYYGSASDGKTSASCLLLEDLSGSHTQPPPGLSPDGPQCESTVLALAKIHAWWWNHSLFGSSGLPQISEALIDEVMATVEAAVPHFEALLGDRLSEPRREIYRRVLDSLPGLLKKRLVGSRDVTLVHGDAHQGNMLWRTQGSSVETIILDWQTWHIDVGTWDLAYFMAASWAPERRQRFEQPLLRTYLDELNNQGVGYTWEDLWFDYRLSIIRQMLLPVTRSIWQPPPVWASQIDPLFMAFDDLDCAELL